MIRKALLRRRSKRDMSNAAHELKIQMGEQKHWNGIKCDRHEDKLDPPKHDPAHGHWKDNSTGTRPRSTTVSVQCHATRARVHHAQ